MKSEIASSWIGSESRLVFAALIVAICGAPAPTCAQALAAYAAGAADRSSYEDWFGSLPAGDYKAGVEFWVTHRSIPREASCSNSNVPAAGEWMHGCLVAQQRFYGLDARRRTDPEYRLGWNSIQSPQMQQAAAARPFQAPSVAPSAQPLGGGMQDCRGINSAIQRLDCYDRIPLAAEPAGQSRQEMPVVPQAYASRRPLSEASTPASVTNVATPSPRQTSEEAFVSIVDAASNDYSSAPNDMLKGALRSKRAEGLCLAIPEHRADNWRGKISVLSSNGDGNGVLAIEINDHITVKTWSNSFSDMSDHTLMSPSSPVFRSAASLAVGMPVIFSGSFLPSQVDCLKEASISLAGSMQSPDFIMRFSSIGRSP